MRLLKLSLENWRAVELRELEFSHNVTLIEGPNEIGKSSIIEAIRLLFNERDSSKKQSVKAIQPLGQDVGSRIQIEVESGEFRFIYAKTFNKSPQTTLQILKPNNKHLTGREAHETVEQMLAQTVDMTLWEALLIDQGEKVALANIETSSGLASALDAAAGSSDLGSDDSGLYQAAQQEHEKYFTAKTGKAKFSAEKDTYDHAKTELETAEQLLAEVESTTKEHQLCDSEVRRIKSLLPTLKAKVSDHQHAWDQIKSQLDKAKALDQELIAAKSHHQSALEAQNFRREIIRDIEKGQNDFDTAAKEQEPLQNKTARLKEQYSNAQQALPGLSDKLKAARKIYHQTQEDERYVYLQENLSDNLRRLKQLEEITQQLKASTHILGTNRATDSALAQLREAESRANIALGARNTAATHVTLTAENTLQLELDQKTLSLDQSQVETRTVTSAMTLRIPDIATIEISPPQSSAELHAVYETAQETLTQLLSRFEVNNLAQAVTANINRNDAQRNVEHLKMREAELLQGTSVEELKATVAAHQTDYDRYITQRQFDQDLPSGLVDAKEHVSSAKANTDALLLELESAQEHVDTLRAQHDGFDNRLRISQQVLAGLSAALAERQERLDTSRATITDERLDENVKTTGDLVKALDSKSTTLKESLNEASAQALESTLKNARDVYDRANQEFISEQQKLAVLEDRLQQAQANGRYEAFESAQRTLEESSRTLELIQRRANASQLLWNTLNEHRDLTRQAYVKPLKVAIEQLGKIVFGHSFEVEIGEDWTIVTRTLNGNTLPFEYLSVGAKEQLSILSRLAAAQIIAPHGGVPLIIDDALGFADPSRLETLGAAIAAAGEQSQIIILTCTPGRFTHVGSADVIRL